MHEAQAFDGTVRQRDMSSNLSTCQAVVGWDLVVFLVPCSALAVCLVYTLILPLTNKFTDPTQALEHSMIDRKTHTHTRTLTHDQTEPAHTQTHIHTNKHTHT